MAPPESLETRNGQNVTSVAMPPLEGVTQDDRLARLQIVLSSTPFLRHVKDEEDGTVGSSSIEDRITRLEIALGVVTDNYSVLEQAITDENDEDDLMPGIKLDDFQTTLVLEHIDLADIIARQYAGRGERKEDLRQVAAIALMKASVRFDPEAGILFATFASSTIRGEIKRHFRDKTWSVRPPRALQETALLVNRALEELGHRQKRTPNLDDIAAELGQDPDVVADAMNAWRDKNAESLDAPLGNDTGSWYIQDKIGHLENDYTAVDDKLLVAELLATLDPQEAFIMRARAGLPPYNRQYSQEEVAQVIGFSQSYLARLEKRVLLKLRDRLTRD